MICYLVVTPIVLFICPATLALPASALLSIMLYTIVLCVLFNMSLGILIKFIMQFYTRNF